MPRPRIIAANLKMNPIPTDAFDEASPYKPHDKVTVIVLPTAFDIRTCVAAGMATGGQYGHPEPKGAYTGDVSMMMLEESGCTYALCGHSERRQHHQETDAMIAAQVQAALDAGLTPIVCIGETADEREMGQTNEVLKRQLAAVKLTDKVIVAYEPRWAIGTGITPTGAQAQETHVFVRSLLPSKDMYILYGGSMNAKNAKEFLSQPDIDGGLIGGASLDPAGFGEIVTIAASLP